MKLLFSYADGAMTVPTALAAAAEKATKKDLRVLLTLAADPLSAIDLAAAKKAAAAQLGLSDADVDSALAFWRGAGVIAPEKEETPKPAAQAAPPAKPALREEKGLPHYTTEELSGLLERRRDLAHLIDACQQTFGKLFNTAEVNIIAGMTDYLGLDGEYILLLLSHCARMGKKSLRYAEKTAISLYDDGVQDAASLEERLRRIEQMSEAIGKIRAMFGISARDLTSKEKAMVENWVCGFRFDEAVLRRAYEVTVDSTGKASLPYANSILERWNAEGLRTVEDVDKALDAYRAAKNGDAMSSFDVNAAFEAALHRSTDGGK